MVCTDWGLISDSVIFGEPHEARAWGLEHATREERAARVIEAGCDQFGGEACPQVIVDIVHRGLVSEERIDTSVRRLLAEKFTLGLFDNPYVDPEAAARTSGRRDWTPSAAP
ncbi:hypothetical protein ACFXJ5_00790 [Streptomyces sp. NPDC059373]